MLTRDLIRLIHKEGNLLPVIVDQSAIGDVQVISANVPEETENSQNPKILIKSKLHL